MKEHIINLGIRKTIALCVIISVLFSMSLGVLFHYIKYILTGDPGDIGLALVMSASIPAVASPFIFTPIIKLVFRAYRLEQQLAYHATYDTLTGLLNRRCFLEFAENASKVNSELKQPSCLLYLDVDKFKSINDEHGHLCGDQVLSALGSLLRNLSRPGDLLCRLGGDEIAIYLGNTTQDNGIRFVERLQTSIANLSLIYDGKPIKFTVSIGLTELSPSMTLADGLIQADTALYNAKRHGRNKCEIYISP